MGNSQSCNKINFEDIQYALKNPDSFLFINTLMENEQQCLIPNTILAEKEEMMINKLLSVGKKDIKVIIYGKNCNDDKIYKKYNQFLNLGFYNTYVYIGGLFEWLLLQDIYGNIEFPTTKKEIDILKYRPNKMLNISFLEY